MGNTAGQSEISSICIINEFHPKWITFTGESQNDVFPQEWREDLYSVFMNILRLLHPVFLAFLEIYLMITTCERDFTDDKVGTKGSGSSLIKSPVLLVYFLYSFRLCGSERRFF